MREVPLHPVARHLRGLSFFVRRLEDASRHVPCPHPYPLHPYIHIYASSLYAHICLIYIYASQIYAPICCIYIFASYMPQTYIGI